MSNRTLDEIIHYTQGIVDELNSDDDNYEDCGDWGDSFDYRVLPALIKAAESSPKQDDIVMNRSEVERVLKTLKTLKQYHHASWDAEEFNIVSSTIEKALGEKNDNPKGT